MLSIPRQQPWPALDPRGSNVDATASKRAAEPTRSSPSGICRMIKYSIVVHAEQSAGGKEENIDGKGRAQHLFPFLMSVLSFTRQLLS